MTKVYASREDMHRRLMRGVNILADNVAATLGPAGRNVILHKKGHNPLITKDGVTVANFVDLEDPVENTAAQIIKQAAAATNTLAGDGTTTSTVLAREMMRSAQRYLAAGVSPVEIKRGMDKAAAAIVENLKGIARPIASLEDIEHIATISANGDISIGKLVSMAVDAVGKDGAITIEEARSMETTLDMVEGFRFDSGYFAKSFVTEERRGAMVYENAMLLVTDHRVENVEDILPALEIAARESRPFVIIAEEVEGQALAALIMNTARGQMKVAAVKAPKYGEERRNILQDLAISVGATFISRDSGMPLSQVKLGHFGRCKKIESLRSFTTILGGDADWEKVEERIETLKEEIHQNEDYGMQACERIQERITRLASGIAIIRVGAATEVEMLEKKHRVEDALEAVYSAQQEGTVPGGGVALIQSTRNLKVDVENEEQAVGVTIIKAAAYAPLMQMAENAGESPDLILSKVLGSKKNKGWNFTSGKLEDLYVAGIIDPVKVTRVALLNSVSAASTLITTNFSIVET
jgi:chaperonin GroEL